MDEGEGLSRWRGRRFAC